MFAKKLDYQEKTTHLSQVTDIKISRSYHWFTRFKANGSLAVTVDYFLK